MRLPTLLAFVGAALSAPAGQQGKETEDVWFVGGHMGLARDSETFVVGISFTLEPSMALCTASNFTMPSSTFKCGDSDYSFFLTKVPEMYSRYTVHISRTSKSGEVLKGDLSFGTNGPIPWIKDQVGTARGVLTSS